MKDKDHTMKIIARIHTDFPTKFGVPRQSGLIKELKAKIVFEPEYRNPDALRGLEEFSHIWIIWEFSEVARDKSSPTVRPPRLGGNTRMGVFATRSPFRPNPIGLSCLKLDNIEINSSLGPILHVSGADMMDKTPIYDIKPYLTYADSYPDATGGYVDELDDRKLQVDFPDQYLSIIPEELRTGLISVLAGDPRPHYQHDPNRIYGFEFADFEVKFKVEDDIVKVIKVEGISK